MAKKADTTGKANAATPRARSTEKWVKPIEFTVVPASAPRDCSVAEIFQRHAIKVGPNFDVLKAIGRR